MKNIFLFLPIALIALLATGCATTSQTVPEAMMQIKPDTECSREAQADGWDIKAQLFEQNGENYMALYFNPDFSMTREPDVKLVAGMAVYLGQDGDTYYYRLGKLPAGRTIGTVIFESKTRNRRYGEMMDKDAQLILERREGSDCIKIVARKYR